MRRGNELGEAIAGVVSAELRPVRGREEDEGGAAHGECIHTCEAARVNALHAHSAGVPRVTQTTALRGLKFPLFADQVIAMASRSSQGSPLFAKYKRNQLDKFWYYEFLRR
eukprot:634960-Pleurochrysis_carterae.AAC.2